MENIDQKQRTLANMIRGLEGSFFVGRDKEIDCYRAFIQRAHPYQRILSLFPSPSS
ncbi:hypothetical protein [Bacillus piscicola]|uniref:hypothetical protein n=1 Tax=Bacillus piscicola TaxID=1632684 RepID=UPI001F0938E0|nr:hypothetical protein [Bacillus piscicola]